MRPAEVRQTPIEVVLNHMSHMNFVVFYAYTAAKCVKPNVMQKACLRGMHYKCLNFHISNLINTETMQDGDFALIMWSTVFHLNYYLSFKLCKWKLAFLFVCLFFVTVTKMSSLSRVGLSWKATQNRLPLGPY